VGGGTIAACFTLLPFALGMWRYATDLATPSSLLHSPILLPFLSLAELREDEEEQGAAVRRDAEGEQGGGAGALVPGTANPMVSPTPPRPTRGVFSVIFVQKRSPIRPTLENMNTFLARFVLGLDKEADADVFPRVMDMEEVFGLGSGEEGSATPVDSPHPRRLTVYVVVLDTEEARHVWERAMRRPGSSWSPEQLVLVSDESILSRSATSGGGAGASRDLVSAESLLKSLLALGPDRTPSVSTLLPSPSSASSPVAADLLRAFEVLDSGRPFPVTPTTVPSGSRTREALRQILPRLGFLTVPWEGGKAVLGTTKGGASSSSSSSSSSSASASTVALSIAYVRPKGASFVDVPALLSTLGPLVQRGPFMSLAKREAVEGTLGIHLGSPGGRSRSRSPGGRPGTSEGSGTADDGVPSAPASPRSGAVQGALSLQSFSLTSSFPSASPTSSASSASRVSPRILDHMQVVYEGKSDSSGAVHPTLLKGSPFSGFVPAVFEAVSLKIGHVLMKSGLQ
jgi:hypothetical protein